MIKTINDYSMFSWKCKKCRKIFLMGDKKFEEKDGDNINGFICRECLKARKNNVQSIKI